jgi:hypothetical protein
LTFARASFFYLLPADSKKPSFKETQPGNPGSEKSPSQYRQAINYSAASSGEYDPKGFNSIDY